MRAFVTAAVLVSVAASLAVAPGNSFAKESRTTMSESMEMAAMREKMKHRPRRIIYNDDGCGPLWVKDGGNTPQHFLYGPAGRMGAVLGTEVDSVFICSGATHVLNHPSSVAESYADIVDRYGLTADGFDYFRDNMRALEALGTDAIKLTADFCRKNGREVFYSYRINDLHLAQGGSMNVERSTWWREHPEYWLGKPANLTEEESLKYPATDPKCWGWASLNFELPEVRAYLLRILDEVANKYDLDGIEIDYMRAPLFFLPNIEGKPATKEQIDILTDFQRQVRLIALRAANKRGKAMLVSARVPTTTSRCLFVGIDIQRWLKDDLVDIVSLGGGYVPLNADWQDMLKLGRRYHTPVYPVLSASGFRGRYADIETWRAAASNAYRAGAKGVYLFNHAPSEPSAQFKELGDPKALAAMDKLFAVENDPNGYWGHYICDMDSSAATDDPYRFGANIGVKPKGRFLPAAIEPSVENPVILTVGDDIRKAEANGTLASANLKVQLSEPSALDKTEVRLNGKLLTDAEKDAAGYWLTYTPKPTWFKTGQNKVTFRLAQPPTGGATVELRALEVQVRYKNRIQ